MSIQVLRRVLPAGWEIRIQSAITTADSEPEPDLTIVRGTPRDYMDHHPAPSDVGLLIEVADTSLDYDREAKGPAYAKVAIPVYWIVNLRDRQIEIYTDPTGPDSEPCYRTRQDYAGRDDVPLVLDGREVARVPASDLLP